MQVSELSFLVVEDDDFQRHWLKAMLNNIGATNVLQASDGNEALGILKDRKSTIDISFIDLNLPGMDGMELIRHMSQQACAPSIVLASALAPALIFSVKTMSKAYGVNLLGSIEKPATPDTILDLIKLHDALPKTRVSHASTCIRLDDIHHGLTSGEFEPFFQPKVHLASGKVKGVEAFARWRHPQLGLLPPASFLPILQEAQETALLDLLMFEEVMQSLQKLQRHDPSLTVSLNAAASSCADPNFVERILAYAATYQVDANKVSFEISESAAVKDAPSILENVVRLRMNGFGVSIDEYGTAHSSIQQLLRIPFSELKIDRSMLRGSNDSPSLEIALHLGFELCRRLDCQSAAVGVENKSNWDMLLKLGCDYAQGYYIAHPMEEEALLQWMKEWENFF